MKDSQGGFVAYVVAIAFILLLAGGSLYLYIKSIPINSGDNTDRLLEARLRLADEQMKLADLKRKHEAEKEIIAKIQKEYADLRDTVLKNTDIFFKNPKSGSPRIKISISDKDVEADINNRRLEITKRLNSWEEKLRIINSNSTPQNLMPTLPDLVKSAQDDMNYIKKYIKELGDIIDGLSTDNSDFTQTQIESYVSIIETNTAHVEEVISVMETIKTAAEQIYQPVATTTAPVVPVVTPIVTPAQIQTQQEIVNHAQEEQAIIEGTASTTPVLPYYDPRQVTLPISSIIYLPPPVYTGWPDNFPDENSSDPLLLEGSNKL